MKIIYWKKPLFVLLFFITTNLVISYIATQTIPYLGYFSYPELLDKWELPLFIKRFASFDGLHYIKIATEGYAYNATAFLPIFPILIKGLINLTQVTPIIAGIMASISSLAVTLCFLPKYLSLINFDKKEINWFLIFFLLFPTSFFLQSVYSESVFIMFLIIALYSSAKKQFTIAMIMGYLAGMTRITGFLLCIPFFMTLFDTIKSPQDLLKNLKTTILSLNIKKIVFLLSPILGFSTYLLYLWITTGDPMRLAHTQVDFDQNRTLSVILPPQVLYRYLKILVTAKWNFQYFIACVELLTAIFACATLYFHAKNIIQKKYKQLAFHAGLNLFAWTSLLLPSFTGTLLSFPRFVLPLFAIFIYLAKVKSFALKIGIVFIFAVLHVILLMSFIQGYFVS